MSTPEDNPFALPSYGAPTYPPPPPSSSPPVPSSPVGNPATSPGPSLPQVNKLATLGLYFSLLTPVLTPLFGIAGVVTGRRALKEIAHTGERGAGRATAAVWVGSTLALAWVLAVAFVLAMVAGSTSA
jgi:hypothetical protein